MNLNEMARAYYESIGSAVYANPVPVSPEDTALILIDVQNCLTKDYYMAAYQAAAYDEYHRHMQQLRDKGSAIIAAARAEGRRIIVLAGRPYHVDPEVNHGIDQLIIRQGAAVVSEDSVSWHEQKFQTSVLNQWTYHSRLYAAAKYCTENPDMDLVQLVSFGCGLDAVTTDETREILQAGGKLYTQLKIDEITNLGAVNIRLRSLFAALEERKEDKK